MKFIFFFLVIFCTKIWSIEDVKIIKNPSPNCIESNFKKLIKYKELKESEESKEFLVSLSSLVVDENENIFAYDPILVKLFKYDSNLQLVKTFGSKGRGPGEIGGGSSGFTPGSLVIKKNYIYFGDWYNKKIICFNTNGDLIREIPFKRRLSPEIIPAVDNSGNIYLHADHNENNKYIIDFFDKNGEYSKGLLARANLFIGLFLKSEPELPKNPRGIRPDWYSTSTSSNIKYSINEKDQLLIYSSSSGYFWVFNQGKLQKTAKIWPKNALLDYKINLKEAAKMGGFCSFFRKLIIDQDNPDRFLLDYGYYKNGDKMFLYQFDLFGKLDKVYYVLDPKKPYISFQYKKSNKFYGISRNNNNNLTISIYKESQNE
ncbi:MAG: hypothetical protein L6428_02945 [Candidatus Aminicenantes bacterium]|nr:hypothetical protein [Candidatus Aminicenantes bacterium]